MSGTDELAALVASSFDQRWHFDPVEATAQGLRDHDGRLGAFTEERVRQHVAGLKATANALEDLNLDDLDDEIDRTALLNDLRVQQHIWLNERPHVRDPGLWINHLLEGLYHLLASTGRAPEGRAAAVQARLEAKPALVDAAEGALAGCPRPFVETAVAMLEGGRQLVAETGALSGEEAFTTARREALTALERLAAHLQGDLLERAEENFAVGLDAFNYRLAFQHAMRATTPEVLRYGAALVDEVSAELQAMAGALRPGTPWPELLDTLREERPPADGLVSAYADAMERARAFVAERGLLRLVDTPLDVMATPDFLAPVIPFAAYQPVGAFDENPRGRFYVTVSDTPAVIRDHCSYDIPIIALHEGWPGHHLQFAIAARQPRMVRRLVSTPLTVEGWALYCEELLAEAGFLAEPEERFFQRVALLWRALRVVLDVGLHTQDVTREQAVTLLVDRLHMDRPRAEAEVRRYAATPAYQLAYAVGRRDLRQLRDDYRAREGDRFDTPTFHDAVLAYGGLPVTLMRWGLGLHA